ncbi:MAG: M15 family metallopeptidase [Fimbriimonadaceae bacterium]|nr:M15 family metallopeptidase [Fimbriimonadaceae bacterium]QYK56649.1 MAG: M15 family metallopeptidase [Fimbriimonadaceae bacterium]
MTATLIESSERAKFRGLRVRGLDVAVESLRGVFAMIRENERDAFEQIQTAGMLCCRYVRGSSRALSNHSWGTAIDLTFNGADVDRMGDERCQVGLLMVYKYFHAAGWYWGRGFSREDSMHFELADETVRRLLA